MKQKYVDDTGLEYWHKESASVVVPPFHCISRNKDREVWQNDLYTVTRRVYRKGFFISNSKYIVLGIINADQSARHDWREFQQIKNMLAGEEWEGIELYPAESRLSDPSNEFFMWCVPKNILKYGLPNDGRNVRIPSLSIAPQRPFPTVVRGSL